nr:PxKF domain-containing protein [Pedococcus sp. 5OH_020]
MVPWTVKGFYAPIDMDGVVNTVKAGNTIPLKFEVFAGDREITAPAEVKVSAEAVSCSTSAPTDEVELTASGNTALRYDEASGQFVYTWKTPSTAGTCYAMTATAADGTSTTAYVKTR